MPPLRRIQVDNSGKEIGGLKGNGNGTSGKPTNVETNSDTSFGRENRCTGMLQGRCGGDLEVHDDMETGLEDLQGFAKEDRMEYGGSCHNES